MKKPRRSTIKATVIDVVWVHADKFFLVRLVGEKGATYDRYFYTAQAPLINEEIEITV